ncbi:MAG: hypothetical protein AAB420_01400 [Patescibacteria group bacterium]
MKKFASYKEDFEEQKRRKFISRANRFIISALITSAIAVVLLFLANLFDVRVLTIQSPSLIPAEDVEAKAWEVLNDRRFGIARKKNILLFSPQKIGPALQKEFPRIDAVDIRRTSLHELSIVVYERVSVGLWCIMIMQQCYYYDASGTAYANIVPSSGYLFVAVNDYRDRNISLGESVAPEDWRLHISEVKKILQFGGIPITSIEIPGDSHDEFIIITREGWKIFYVNDGSIRTQTNSLLVFLREKLAPSARANLEYVDLRIEDRIYYKQK